MYIRELLINVQYIRRVISFPTQKLSQIIKLTDSRSKEDEDTMPEKPTKTKTKTGKTTTTRESLKETRIT
jgi:hypothetical protein